MTWRMHVMARAKAYLRDDAIFCFPDAICNLHAPSAASWALFWGCRIVATVVMNPVDDQLSRVWRVDALCRAVADALHARFNPVRVSGEISGFSRAVSGHCYFSLKDANAQLRCAMFKRAAAGLDFDPRDGEKVEVTAKLDLYGPRGDLQLIVEAMRPQGMGHLFEEFVQLKARLQAQGLFDAARKRELPRMPNCIGVVTSLGAAALHDVVATLRRRVSHVPVVLSPASVQGAAAAGELINALHRLVALRATGLPVDVILLVRGGGSLEDLWAFNDEQLALAISQCPVPVVCGVGHETDFTIADFVADVRAPTPTAAAEMVATPTAVCAGASQLLGARLSAAAQRVLDQHAQRLDRITAHAGRPSVLMAARTVRVSNLAHQLRLHTVARIQSQATHFQHATTQLHTAAQRLIARHREHHLRLGLRLEAVNPKQVLQRGYAWLTDSAGGAVVSANVLQPGQGVRATLCDGAVDLTVEQVHRN